MLEVIGSLIGFGASAVPAIMGYFQDSKDKKHELALQEKLAQANIKEAEVSGEFATLALELKASIASVEAAHKPMVMTGIGFIDGLRGSVRPLVTYWFMALYSYSKVAIYLNGGEVWTQWDQTLLATVISFWFGDRLLTRKNK